MRIVAWNVAHQTRERRLSAKLLESIDVLDPDILVLNEYVHGPSRTEFLRALADLGLKFSRFSNRVGTHNQVLIASRTKLLISRSRLPSSSEAARSNWLAVYVPEFDLDLAGMRVPAFGTSSREARLYFDVFTQIEEDLIDTRAVIIGDMNADPSANHHGARALRAAKANGWHLPAASGEWSWRRGGQRGFRIDHALVSPIVGFPTAA